METLDIKYFTEWGAFAVLFVCLFIYEIKSSNTREDKYLAREVKYQEIIKNNQDIIKDYNYKIIPTIETVQKDVEDIKECLKK